VEPVAAMTRPSLASLTDALSQPCPQGSTYTASPIPKPRHPRAGGRAPRELVIASGRASRIEEPGVVAGVEGLARRGSGWKLSRLPEIDAAEVGRVEGERPAASSASRSISMAASGLPAPR
jgi:hypothetical protein